MVNFDNIQSPSELTEEQKKAIALHQKIQKTVLVSVTAGVLVTIALGIITMLLLMHFGVISFNKNALKKQKAEQTAIVKTAGSSASAINIATKILGIEQILNKEFLGEINQEEIYDNTLKAYLKSYNDEYTEYYTKDEFTSLYGDLNGEFYGIGIYGEKKDGEGIRVLGFTDNSLAKNVGLKENDEIIKIDGTDIRNMSSDVAINHLKSDKPSKVSVTVLRNGQELEFTINRVKITKKNVSSIIIQEGNIGYVKISAFNEKTREQFQKEMKDLEEKGANKYIIDLRNNGGGTVSSAVEILDDILPTGTFGYTTYKNGETKEIRGNTKEELNKPYVVLSNEYTASASEIIVGAIKDFGKGTVIGTKTYGKGVGQKVVSFKDGSGMKYTESKFSTPKGYAWNKKGIEPNILVEIPKNATEDTQLIAAVNFLNAK